MCSAGLGFAAKRTGLMERDNGISLLCRVDTRLCALSLANVVETMRPLPVEPVAGTPGFVLGLSVVRGSAVPVVDVGRLLSGKASSPTRFVLLRAGDRRVVLAVEGVVGVRPLDAVALHAMPPLMGSAEGGVASSIGALDAELLLVLNGVRWVPEDVLASMEAQALAS
jgi:purine-binding chemotaxis protein CheW